MSTDTKSPSSEKTDEIDLLSLAGVLLDYRKLILSVTACFLVIGVLYAVLAAPVYEADAVIQIEPKKASLPGMEDLDQLTGKDPEAVTEIELIKSRWVVGKAVDAQHLDIDVHIKRFPAIGGFIARHFKPTHPGDVAEPPFSFLNSYDWGGTQIQISHLEVPDELLNKKLLLVVGANNSYTLSQKDDILLTGSVGELAKQNGISMQVGTLVAHRGQNIIVARWSRLAIIDQFRKKLSASERGKNTGIVGLSYENTDSDFAKLALGEIAHQYVQQNVERMAAEAANSVEFLRQQLPQVRQEMERAGDALNQYQVKSKSVSIDEETSSLLDQVVKLDTDISSLKLKQVEMNSRFTREHPAYQTLLSQLATMEANKKELESKVANLPQTQKELLQLNRDVDVSTQIYTQLLNKEQELDIVRAGTVGNARIIDDAAVDITTPVWPKRALIVLLALVLGALCGSAAAGIHMALSRGVENPDELEQLGVAVTATIPYSELQQEIEKALGDGTSSILPLLALTHPTDPAVEAIRSLRTSLYFTLQEARNNIVMVSGPSPLVGKTFVSANMAVMMAQAGKKVLLVDADMRKGYMHKFFLKESERVTGLADILRKDVALESAIVSTAVPGLDFIPRGTVPDNPSELLLSPRFGQVLKQASATYDVIIIDTPPVLAVADAIIVAKLAGSNFIVTRFSKNPIGEVRATIRRLESNGITLNGTILNATRKRSLAYYGYYKYGYGNYQYDYYHDKKRS